jgi:hypothetical protein
MKLTGPLAVPPPRSDSCEERSLLRLMPAPEPPLKISPSSTYQLMVGEQMLQFVAKGLALLVTLEVAVLVSPGGDAIDDAIDDLLQRGLALGRAEGAAEVLLRDDVGGVERPADRKLDIRLLEDHAAIAVVADAGIAQLPFEFIVGMNSRGCEVPLQADWRTLRDLGSSAAVLFREGRRLGLNL